MSMTPLADNHVEVMPGTPKSPIAPPGALLPSDEYVDLSSLLDTVQDLAPQAQELIKSLNDRVVELKVTLGRVNDLMSDQNRSNLSAVAFRFTRNDPRKIVPNSSPRWIT